MKRYLPGAVLLVALVYLSSTAFQCGSAETTSAKLYMQQKQWQKAEASLTKEIAKNDKNEEAWYLLGAVRLEMKNYAGMNDAYTRALALGDAHKNEITHNRLSIWGSMYNEGVNFYNRGKDTAACYDSALARFTTAIMMEPDSAGTYYVTALDEYAKQDYEGAQTNLQLAMQKNPRFFDAARFLGQLQYTFAQKRLEARDTAGAVADYGKAAEAFRTAFDVEPNNADNIQALIDAYERSHQSDKAETITRDAVTRDSTNKFFRYAYGVFLLKREQFPEAIAQFQKTLEIDPSYADATYNLGVAYLNWGVAIKAAADKAADAQKKGSRPVKEDTSYKEKFKLALPYLEQGVQLRPDDAALWTQLARLYAILNMPDKSRAAFEKADKLAKGK
ncbi:MAG TPA: tetratricopeptide repeat protein [Bacteroidota bacterium]|nr:tetratricopeptide repeat protein [Bacteroidota bacterium]